METKNERIIPFMAVHPGVILGDELDARGISIRGFSKSINVKNATVKAFVKGKCSVTEWLAVRFEESLGISAKTWLGIQEDYSYHKKVIKARKGIK